MEKAEISRIDAYDDARFSDKVLRQHGAFAVNGKFLYEVEITGAGSAVVRGENRGYYESVIEEFRFYAEHIHRFYDEAGNIIKEYEKVRTFQAALRDIQPSQFYVDSAKKKAVASFIDRPDDIIIPLTVHEGRYISLDGHTRLAVAAGKGFDCVTGFLTNCDDFIYEFVEEARKRGIVSPYDMTEVSHEVYEVKWNRFCDEFFSKKTQR